MQRLTYKNNLDEAYLECGADAIWKKCEGYDVLENAISKLAEYEDLEEQGRLIKLPCKVGDTVYSLEFGKIKEYVATAFKILDGGIFVYHKHIFIGTLWASVFATKEEAEKALAEMGE